MLNKIKLVVRTVKSEEFQQALAKCASEFKKIKMAERKDLLELKLAIKEEKANQAKFYDNERKIALTRLFTQAMACYKAERLVQQIRTGEAKTIYDY